MVWGKLGIWFWSIAILGFWATVMGNWRFSEGKGSGNGVWPKRMLV